MMRFIDLWIRVQPRVVHDTINQVIYDCGNRIDAPEAVIERFLGWRFLAMGLIRHASPSSYWKHPTPRHFQAPRTMRRSGRRLPGPAQLGLLPC
jgi:hypothetical protein